jgi:hypothetical protein
VLASLREEDAGPTIRRSWHAKEFTLHLEHDLGVAGFFAGLALTSRDLPNQGLYAWLGDDEIRRTYAQLGGRAAPDGWGRYLAADREITFHLEWDTGTETPQRLTEKVRGYADYHLDREADEFNHVLWVASREAREVTVRRAIARARPDASVRHWTTNEPLLCARGALGPLWWATGESDVTRAQLAELPGRERSARKVEQALGKPGWWEWRPGAGEGA